MRCDAAGCGAGRRRPFRIRRYGPAHAQRPGVSTRTTTGRRRRLPGGSGPAVPGGSGPVRGGLAGVHAAAAPGPVVPGFPAWRRTRIPARASWACHSSISKGSSSSSRSRSIRGSPTRRLYYKRLPSPAGLAGTSGPARPRTSETAIAASRSSSSGARAKVLPAAAEGGGLIRPHR